MGAAVKSLVGAAVVALVVSVLLTPYGSRCLPGGGWAPEYSMTARRCTWASGVFPLGGAAIIVAMWRATVIAMRKCLSAGCTPLFDTAAGRLQPADPRTGRSRLGGGAHPPLTYLTRSH